MEDAKPPTLAGLAAPSKSLLARFERSGEDRLVGIFVVVSIVVHATVLLLGPIHWLRDKPPLADEWSLDADLVSDIDLPPPTKTTLPKAEIAPTPKAPAELLPQLPKKFAVKEPTKADDAVAVEKEPQPVAKPAEVEKKAEEPIVKTETKDDNLLEQKEILKRAALERLRLEEKTAKTAEAPEKDPLARLAEAYEKNKKSNAGFASANAKGKINKYLASLKQAVRQNYSLPTAYNLKGAALKVAIAVTVSESGDLLDLQVKQPSNDPAFDELTLQAVKASAPLPKPPKELAGEPILLTFTPQEGN